MFSSRAQCKDGGAAFLSLLEVLGPKGKSHSALLSLLWHGVVAAHAQCKEEASEYTGFQRHGNADTPEQNRVPECLRQNLYEQLRKTIKMLKNDKKSKLKLKEQISVAFQLRLRMSKMLILKQIPRSSSRRTCGKFTVSNLRLTYSEQSKLLGRNGVKKICVRPSLLVLVFSSIWEFFCFFYQA